MFKQLTRKTILIILIDKLCQWHVTKQQFEFLQLIQRKIWQTFLLILSFRC